MPKPSERIASRHKAVFTDPPERIPSNTQTDAPLLGNGDMGVAVSGAPEAQRFWLAKNDFWRLKSQYNTAGPRVFGWIDVSIPSLAGASYHADQALYEAVTRSTFTAGALTVKMRSWVAATKNMLVVQLSAHGASAQTTVTLSPAEGPDSDEETGDDDGVRWAVRKFTRDVDIPVEAAAAMKLSGAKRSTFTLAPGKPVTIVVAMASMFKAGESYLPAARKLADGLDPKRAQALWKAHTRWWRNYWGKSYVEIPDKAIEGHYYLSQYVLGSCSRDPRFPPSIFGTWITDDQPAWSGDYHLNYNHMAPYYGLYSSNHLAQADPCHAPLLAFAERGRWYARKILDCRGVYCPVGIGPLGIETTRNCPRHAGQVQEGGLFFGQKSNSAYCVVNLSMRWRATYDVAYAGEVYPFVLEVAEFWEDYLTFEDDRYVVCSDSIHEGSGDDFNPILALGLIRNVLETALEMSDALAVDADRHDRWRHILDHLSEYPTQEMHGKTVFRYTERGTPWWKNNTLGVQHIYPAGGIGLDSDPALLEISRNTIEAMDRWIDGNGTNSFFPAAVRVGVDPAIILAQLNRYVTEHTQPNGFTAENPHGIENCSTVPNTINMMLCSAHGGALRVFAVWPKHADAKFANLRVEGAFLVASEIVDGAIPYVTITSDRGRRCTVVNPWPDAKVQLSRNNTLAETLEGERFTFETVVGERIRLSPAKVVDDDDAT